MDFPKRKIHKSSDESESSSPKALPDVVNWQNSMKVAIEYYESLENRIYITYNGLYCASKKIEQLLKNCCSSKFIGLGPEVSTICIPALMIGINISNNAFVCLQSFSTSSDIMNGGLKIQYLFAQKRPDNTELIKEVHIHNISLLFLKFEQYSLENPFGGKNIYAYGVTTSGSTGNPIVVRVTHASIIPNIVALKSILQPSSEDKIAQLTPLTFDPSVIEIFITLSCSGTLFITSREVKNDPQKLLASLVASNVTIMQTTPSLLMHRWSSKNLRSTIFGRQSHLRILLLGGELLPNPDILFNLKHPENKCRFFNIYGITEVSCWASIIEILSGSNPRDLGQVLKETLFEVRDKNGKIVSEGEGQLYIGSYSRICLTQDEKMEEMKLPVFRCTGDLVTINNCGKIFYNGRKNRRAKRFGHRIDLQYLEDHVNQLDFVENSHSIFLPKKQSLHIFFISRYGTNDGNAVPKLEYDVLKHIEKLSEIYHPDKVNLIQSFPLTTNGKICTHSLRRICKISHEEFDTLDNVKIFQAIWYNYFVRQDSGFVEIGGTSVIALQIANEMSEKTGNEYPELIGRMLRNETLDSCTVYISQGRWDITSKFLERDKPESSRKSLDLTKIEKTSIIRKSREETEWLWQKFRGRVIFNNDENTEIDKICHPSGDINRVREISMRKSYNLLKCVDASPTIFCCHGEIYATVGSHSGIICTVQLGEEYVKEEGWKVQLPDRIEASILVGNNFKGIVGCYDGFVYCTDLRLGEILWKFGTGDAVKCSAIFCSKRQNIFFGSYDNYVYCISSKDGTAIWKAKPSDASISATPVVHQRTNSVLFGTLDGTCVSLDQKTGNILWICQLEHPIFSAPVISHNESALFCDVSGVLAAFDVEGGNQIWRTNIEGNVFSHLVLRKDRDNHAEKLIVTSRNKNLYIFEIESKNKQPNARNKMEFSSSIIATPWVDNDFVTIALTKGELVIMDLKTCDITAKYDFQGEVYSSPVVHEDFIAIGCRDNNLYILSRK